MRNHRFRKFLVLTLSITTLAFFTLFGMLFFSLMTPYPNLNLYLVHSCWIFALIIVLYIILRLYTDTEKVVLVSWIKAGFVPYRRVLKWGISSFLVLLMLGGIGVAIHDIHMNSIRLSDRGIDLLDYVPFRNKPSLARLDDVASYQMSENVLHLDGATALYPIYSAFVEAVYPQRHYSLIDSEIQCTQTGTAYQRLIQKETDVIFVAGPSQAQLQAAQAAGVELVLVPIGKEAFIFFTHENNPVSSLTISQIQGIYSGQITHWSQVGGRYVEIAAFQRPEGSGSQTALQRLMDSIPIMTPKTEWMVAGMGGVLQQTAQYRNQANAIGYSFRFYAMQLVNVPKLKYLSINGVYPSKESILDETYPITSNFYAIYLKDNTHLELQPFIDWITSNEGQELIERTGYVALGLHS